MRSTLIVATFALSALSLPVPDADPIFKSSGIGCAKLVTGACVATGKGDADVPVKARSEARSATLNARTEKSSPYLSHIKNARSGVEEVEADAIRNEGRSPAIRNEGRSPAIRNEGRAIRNEGRSPAIRNEGRAIRNEGRSPAIRNKGRSPAIRNEGRSPAIRNEGRSPAIRNEGRSPAIRNEGRSPAIRNEGRAIRNEGRSPAIRNEGRAIRNEGRSPILSQPENIRDVDEEEATDTDSYQSAEPEVLDARSVDSDAEDSDLADLTERTAEADLLARNDDSYLHEE